MKQLFFAGIVLSSVVLATGMLENAVKAKSSTPQTTSQHQLLPRTSTAPIYISQSYNSLESIEQAVHTQINQYRNQRGLPPFQLDANISNQARGHSQNMANGTVPFSHNGFQQRVSAIASVIPYTAAAENVAYNQGYADPATKAVQGWLKSPGHLKNIEGSYNLTGIGVAKNAKGEYYLTQVFIRKR